MGGDNFTMTTEATFKLIESITKAEATKNKVSGPRFDPADKSSTADQKSSGGVQKANRSLN
jgi:hypothetical protein